MNITPPGLTIAEDGRQTARITRAWASWATKVTIVADGLTQAGTTADRPTENLWVGRMYFDTTLGKPIWYKSPGWVDSGGSAA